MRPIFDISLAAFRPWATQLGRSVALSLLAYFGLCWFESNKGDNWGRRCASLNCLINHRRLIMSIYTAYQYRPDIIMDNEFQYSTKVRMPETVRDLVKQALVHKDRENFVVLFLNTANIVVGLEIVSTGLVNTALVHPRETFKSAIMMGVSSIILAHNHPSGEVDPSHEDRSITRRLVEAGELLDVPVLDHIIVNCFGDNYYSFRENGLI